MHSASKVLGKSDDLKVPSMPNGGAESSWTSAGVDAMDTDLMPSVEPQERRGFGEKYVHEAVMECN